VDQQFEAILPSFHISLAREMKTVFERACQCVAILELWNQATFGFALIYPAYYLS
jgi:hypothetical protein